MRGFGQVAVCVGGLAGCSLKTPLARGRRSPGPYRLVGRYGTRGGSGSGRSTPSSIWLSKRHQLRTNLVVGSARRSFAPPSRRRRASWQVPRPRLARRLTVPQDFPRRIGLSPNGYRLHGGDRLVWRAVRPGWQGASKPVSRRRDTSQEAGTGDPADNVAELAPVIGAERSRHGMAAFLKRSHHEVLAKGVGHRVTTEPWSNPRLPESIVREEVSVRARGRISSSMPPTSSSAGAAASLNG